MIVEIAAIVTERPGAEFALTPCRLEGPREDEVLVRVEAVGLCHTDLGVAAGYLPDLPFPAVLGHEGAGVVEAVGRNVHHVATGDHVVTSDHVVITGPRCPNCRCCRDGRPAYCQRADELVFSCRRADGSTALSRTSLTAEDGRERDRDRDRIRRRTFRCPSRWSPAATSRCPSRRGRTASFPSNDSSRRSRSAASPKPPRPWPATSASKPCFSQITRITGASQGKENSRDRRQLPGSRQQPRRRTSAVIVNNYLGDESRRSEKRQP